MSAATFRLKATLRGIRPPIWRSLRVPCTLTLGQLHQVLQIAFGWANSHLHQFRAGPECFGVKDPGDPWGADVIDERRVRLEQVAAMKSKLVYDYDFGDGWEHDVVVEAVEPAMGGGADLACLDGRRACPPEDCGGPGGYAALLRALANPKHPVSAPVLEWLQGSWDPEHFDVDFVNRQLRSIRLPRQAPPRRATPSRKIRPRKRD